MPIAVSILLLVLVAALVGAATLFGTPLFGVLIALLALAGWGVAATMRRAHGKGPVPEEDQHIEFSARDQATLLPTPDEAEKADLRRRAAEHEQGRS